MVAIVHVSGDKGLESRTTYRVDLAGPGGMVKGRERAFGCGSLSLWE